MDIELRELTDDEKKKIKEDEDKKRVSKYKSTSSKEESLVIKQVDMTID